MKLLDSSVAEEAGLFELAGEPGCACLLRADSKNKKFAVLRHGVR